MKVLAHKSHYLFVHFLWYTSLKKAFTVEPPDHQTCLRQHTAVNRIIYDDELDIFTLYMHGCWFIIADQSCHALMIS